MKVERFYQNYGYMQYNFIFTDGKIHSILVKDDTKRYNNKWQRWMFTDNKIKSWEELYNGAQEIFEYSLNKDFKWVEYISKSIFLIDEFKPYVGE